MNQINIAPTLEWKTLLSALLSGLHASQDIAKYWCKEDEQAYWFSRSAWSLLAVAQWWEMATGKKQPCIWVPDYFCNQSLEPLRQNQAQLHFYPITETLNPDWKQCQKLVADAPPAIFILVHYFGIPAEGAQARRFCNKMNALLVEDAAHVLIPEQGVGTWGDFICYSPHKLLAIPDGAVLVQRIVSRTIKKLVGESSAPQIMQSVLADLPPNAPTPWPWLGKRILQQLLPKCLMQARRKTVMGNFDDTASAIALPKLPRQSSMSRSLLQVQVHKLEQYASRRKENKAVLDSGIKPIAGICSLWEADSHVTPYLAVYCCETVEHARDFFNRLRQNCPVQTWPDLPPEVLANRKKSAVAIRLRYSILTLPVHQGINVHAMDNMRQYCQTAFRAVPAPLDYWINWYEGETRQWNTWLASVGQSNLLQSWAYGDSKAKVEGWGVRRGLILRGEEPVALFQNLEKYWGPVGVVRINRGPILLDDLKMADKQAIYQALHKKWRWWRGHILLIAPELENTPEHRAILTLTGYRCRKHPKYTSAWVDLSQTEDELRKKLKGKWRNMLVVAEKSGLVLKVGATTEIFHSLMNHYKEMMSEKEFKGPSIALLTELHHLLKKHDQLLVCQAIDPQGNVLASILLVGHGVACTYLVGWNGSEGRRLKANNYLLWHGLLEMKRRGYQWFDVGGINEKETPDITRFKRGMAGNEYSLLGEYIN